MVPRVPSTSPSTKSEIFNWIDDGRPFPVKSIFPNNGICVLAWASPIASGSARLVTICGLTFILPIIVELKLPSTSGPEPSWTDILYVKLLSEILSRLFL